MAGIDSYQQEDLGLLLYNGFRKENMWSPGDLLGHPLVLPCSVVTVNGHIQKSSQPEKVITTKRSDPSSVKVCYIPPG